MCKITQISGMDPLSRSAAMWSLGFVLGGGEKSGQHPMSNLEAHKRGSGLLNLSLWICEDFQFEKDPLANR